MIVISVLGWFNFRRETARLLERLASIKKIERELGFHEIRSGDKELFPDDNYLLPKNHVEDVIGIKTTRFFVIKNLRLVKEKNKIQDKTDETNKIDTLREYGSAYSIFTWLFIVFVIISIVLIIIPFLIHFLNVE